MDTRRDPRLVRALVAGGAAGFLAGALLMAAAAWFFGDAIASRLAKVDHPADSSAVIDTRGAGLPTDIEAGPGEADTPEVLVEPHGSLEAPPAGSEGTEPASAAPAPAELADRNLGIPVEGIPPERLVRSFAEARGVRLHEAIDILAPRNTPVLAVEGGTIARLFYSNAGGITIYQFDPTERYCYYYAHLERYAEGLAEGQSVKKGQVIGYVGVSGNAPPDTPHLHFAIYRLSAEKRWWEGTPIDPFNVLSRAQADSLYRQ